MEIKINNVGHIEDASIDLDSITIIAGNNNSGKSTVGRVLYATATGLNLLDSQKVLLEKGEVIASRIDTFSRLIELNSEEEIELEAIKEYCEYGFFINEFSGEYKNDYEKIDKLFSKKIKDAVDNIVSKIINRVAGSKKNIIKLVQEDVNIYLERSISDKNYKLNIMQKVFDNVFAKQITSLFVPESYSSISIKEFNQKEIRISMYKQQLKTDNTELELDRPFNKAIYIDNPFILDDVANTRRRFLKSNDYSYSSFLLSIIASRKRLNTSNLFELDIRESQIQNIFKNVMKDGKITFDDGLSYVMNDEISTPLSLQNLSTGLKSFSIMEILLKSEVFLNLEYLILDEPEIHLHPEWQIKFAELIVLISKQFNIKVIITSHSPYFIEAIELYSKKHDYSTDVRFYRTVKSTNNEKLYNIQEVTGDITPLYNDLANAFFELEDLRESIKFKKSKDITNDNN